MKKKPLRIAAIAAAILVIAYFGFSLVIGSIVTAGINRFAPGIVHVPVTLESARISPLSGAGTLSGLVVGNPPGWSSVRAFSMKQIHVEASPFSLLGDHIVVKEVLIDGPEFVYETKVLSSNIGALLKGMDSDGDGGGAKPETASGKPMKFEVRHFRLQNGTIRLGVGPAAIALPMPTIDLTDLGTREGGITANQLALRTRMPATRTGEILHQRRSVSPETALRLARFFGTSPEF